MLEKEQGYLKTDRWYYEYTKEEFIKLTKQYPYIPFFVDNGTSDMKYYRWNTKNQTLESIDATQIFFDNWVPGDIHIKNILSRKQYLMFIIYTDVLTTSICKKKEGIEIIINNVQQELVPKKNKENQYQKREMKLKCI